MILRWAKLEGTEQENHKTNDPGGSIHSQAGSGRRIASDICNYLIQQWLANVVLIISAIHCKAAPFEFSLVSTESLYLYTALAINHQKISKGKEE